MAAPAGSHVADFLRSNDPDRYYATLVLPAAARDPVQALYAFTADLAAIAGRVREPNAGEIRLQWWHDAISGEGHGDVARHPLAAALLVAIRQYSLPTGPLLKLLDARAFDLYNDPMPDLPAFEGYAGATVSVPYQLAAMIVNGGAPVEPGDAAGHLGVAHALIGHLSAFGYHSSRGHTYLPWSVLAANGVERDEVLAGTVSEGLLAGLGQLHDIAADHLDKAAVAIDALPRHLRPVFATIAVLRSDLDLMRRAPERPFSPPPRRSDWQRIAALSWWTWRHARGGRT